MTLEKTLQEFDKEFVGTDGFIKWNNELNVHTVANSQLVKTFIITSHITQWESEIKRLRGLVNDSVNKNTYNQTPEEIEGYNFAISNQISHYQNLISEAKKLI